MKSLLLLSLMALCTGCALNAPVANPGQIHMHSDTQYSAAERKCVEDSAEVWRDQTSGLADVVFDWDFDSSDPRQVRKYANQPHLVRWTSLTPELVRTELEEEVTILGIVSPSGGIKATDSPEMRLIADRLTDPNMCRLTAIHEIGHILGLPHVETSKWNIMYPMIQAGNKECLKPDDLLMYCYVNFCGNVPMKPCGVDGVVIEYTGLPMVEFEPAVSK